MEITFSQLANFVNFINKIENETYPEQISQHHSRITSETLATIIHDYNLDCNGRILDIGCGQGPALDFLTENGYKHVTGISLNDEDVLVCRQKGYDVRKMDQSFLELDDCAFDLVWARHVVEHSIFPYFTLTGFYRVLAPGGMMYMEVPAPETSCRHETNPNHYSVLNKGAWRSLLERSSFTLLEELTFQFTTGMGPDEYWGFICRKCQ